MSVCIFLSLYENIDNCKDIHVYFFYNRSKAESLVINIIHELIWQGCKIDLSRLKNIFRWFVCIKHRLVIHSSSLGDVYKNNALIKKHKQTWCEHYTVKTITIVVLSHFKVTRLLTFSLGLVTRGQTGKTLINDDKNLPTYTTVLTHLNISAVRTAPVVVLDMNDEVNDRLCVNVRLIINPTKRMVLKPTNQVRSLI